MDMEKNGISCNAEDIICCLRDTSSSHICLWVAIVLLVPPSSSSSPFIGSPSPRTQADHHSISIITFDHPSQRSHKLHHITCSPRLRPPFQPSLNRSNPNTSPTTPPTRNTHTPHHNKNNSTAPPSETPTNNLRSHAPPPPPASPRHPIALHLSSSCASKLEVRSLSPSHLIHQPTLSSITLIVPSPPATY